VSENQYRSVSRAVQLGMDPCPIGPGQILTRSCAHCHWLIVPGREGEPDQMTTREAQYQQNGAGNQRGQYGRVFQPFGQGRAMMHGTIFGQNFAIAPGASASPVMPNPAASSVVEQRNPAREHRQ
jgi:hypothetical protein